MEKVAALVSGGVDSSVALADLHSQGNKKITAYYLKIWLEDDLAHLGECPWQEDLEFARSICERLSVPLKVIPLQRPYWEMVVEDSVRQLKRGFTPSPDLLCNRHIKFGAFQDALGESVDGIATGHYARTRSMDGGHQLLRGVDPVKDQTYFLSRMTAQQLALARFPIGHLSKAEVRQEAEAAELANRHRPDSQGICFLGKIRYPEFVKAHLGERTGKIVQQSTGKVLGRHKGYWFHTIGQRKGLGLSGGPWFVIGKSVDDNVVFVEHHSQAASHQLHRHHLCLTDLHWLGRAPIKGRTYQIKLRHGPHCDTCEILESGPDFLKLRLDQGDKGIAPGQFAVLYDGEVCVGSGVMDHQHLNPQETALQTDCLSSSSP